LLGSVGGSVGAGYSVGGVYEPGDLERQVREEPKGSGRTPFQRDRARVLHSAALRRLAGKTQVVVAGEDDFPRTRLTHSLECAQVGREIGQALGADPDLVDAACLAHDLGHPPFGHNGEVALDGIAAAAGGFEGNAQSFRLLTRLEVKVPGAGLNLTRAALDAATKYPWPRRPGTVKFGVYADDLEAFRWARRGTPDDVRSIEAQVMDWADDVAYSVHDLEDGIHAGLIVTGDLDPEAVIEVALEYLPGTDRDEMHEVWRVLTHGWPKTFDGGPRDTAQLKALTSDLIGRFCAAAVDATRAACGGHDLTRYAADLVVPARVRRESALLKAVALDLVMRHPQRLALQSRQRELLHELAASLREQAPDALDPLLQPAWHAADDVGKVRVVADQLAGLTDVSAVAWHARLV
jgi:dGTPase